MANRIKSISKYSGSAWGTETPIGADAANVDLATSYTTVTESTATSGATAEAAIGKIHTDTTNLKKAGHGNGTVTNYDSTSSETSKVLTTDCVVAASDDTATAWSKFNRFRRRVSNKFADYFQTANLVTSSTGVTTTGADTTVYTSKAINNYLANVVGYTDSTAPSAGTIASQLSSLNDNVSGLNDRSVSRLEGVSVTQPASSGTGVGAYWIIRHWNFSYPDTTSLPGPNHFVEVWGDWGSPQFSGTLINGWYNRLLGPWNWPVTFQGHPHAFFNLDYWGTGVYWGEISRNGPSTFYISLWSNLGTSAEGNGRIVASGWILDNN